ncbi:DUF4381 domain-containing protein [Halioglobus maricola]|uniref:DUF4381 domain-containing protein n=1 Tax=Halioglobus maricola TaxID=2601894 RepID=A0A5P9NGF3_9GAMM|nr:DUF4381 domain-containing protein [Halioglobus maricola]QFU74274.1 DUF4381 domain-containing protein [Halioglobus maricola]
MSLPPLPDIFGNYVLGDDFHEVVSPEAVNWWPQTPGWYAVGAVILVLLGRYSWRRIRYWYRNRYRKEARLQLQSLPQAGNHAREINQILKRAALAAYSRTDVASLSGQEWINFLNSRCSEPAFDATQCQCLAEGIYAEDALDKNDRSALIEASVRWLSAHRNRFGD